MSQLFTPVRIRDIEFKNRIGVSPMCEYSCQDGVPNEWHLVHLGSRAVGGSGLILTEASGVSPEGRISPFDAGIYTAACQEAWARIVDFIHRNCSIAGIQLAHAGRKASTDAPWNGGRPITMEQGGWSPIFGPSSMPFSDGYATPEELDSAGIRKVVTDFKAAAQSSLEAGFKVIEIHGAHGYLLHEFLSPLSNERTDRYGGSFENRIRIVREVTTAVREVWPERLPLFLRISSTDWTPGGWTIEESVELARVVKALGVDLIDCSSGGNVPNAQIPVGPGYQVEFAERIKREANILTAAVGMITEPHQAEQIVAAGQADMVLLARESLRDPYFPRRAAKELGVSIEPPKQYGRAW